MIRLPWLNVVAVVVSSLVTIVETETGHPWLALINGVMAIANIAVVALDSIAARKAALK